MLNSTFKHLLILSLSLFLAQRAVSQCGDSIDFATWVKEGISANGTWTVGGGGSFVNQTINGNPTFYVSPDSFINVIIRGDIKVNTTGDDDWIGFVFGYNDPDSSSSNNYDFYLFDWKQADQNFTGYFGAEGMCLSRINGPITNLPEAFSSKTGPYATILDSDFGSTKGWNDKQTYEFALTYTNTRAVISVDGDTVFDIYGCFPPGRFGFYNYSQSDVIYSNFSYKVAAAFKVLTPNVCVHDTARFIALSDSCENAAGIPVNNTLVGWDWDFGDGTTSTDTNANHVYDTAGVYNVSLVVTDYLGCKDTAYSQVEIFKMTVDLGPDSAICTNDSIILDAHAATRYAWSTNDTNQTINAPWGNTYSVTVTGPYGCIGADTITLGSLPIPTVDLGADTSICNYDSIVLNAGNVGWAKLWQNGSTADTFLVTQTTATYYCRVTDTLGCEATDTIVVSNFAQPNVSPPNPELCFGDTISIAAAGANTYKWYPNYKLSSDTGVNVMIYTQVDTTYFVIGTDSNGCTDTSSFLVNVNELPTVNFSGGDSICFGDSIFIAINLTGAGPWGLSYDLNHDTTNWVNVAVDATGFYASDSGWFKPFFVSDSKCVNQGGDSTFVFLNPLPVMNIASANDTLCFGSEMTLTASSAMYYSWTPTTALNDTTNAIVQASPTSSIRYRVRGKTIHGCLDTTSIFIEVLPLPTVSFSVSEDTLCLNDSVILSASGGVEYAWTTSPSGNTSANHEFIHFPTVSSYYKVSITDIFGCTDSLDTNVVVHDLPVVDVTPSDTSFCLKDSTTLTAAGAQTYLWTTSGFLSSTTGNAVIAKPSVTSQFFVTGTDSNGCKNIDSSHIVIFSLPNVQITPQNSEICFGLSDSLLVSGALSYLWSPNYAISDTTSSHVIIQPDNDTSYVVAGKDVNGCVTKDTIDIVVFDLPNVQIITDSDSVCYGLHVELQATGADHYTWANTAGLSSYSQPTVLATPLVNSSYQVVGTDLNGCINSVDTFINVIPLPIITVTPAVGDICYGESRELYVPIENSYVWLPASHMDMDGNNNDTISAHPIDTTLYTITATNYFECVSETLYNLPVTPLPVVSITSQFDTVCSRENNVLTASGANSYAWGPPQYVSNLNTSTTTVDPPSTLDFYVTGTGPGGCKSSDTLRIFVYPIPSFSGGGNKEICEGDSVQLSATGGISYVWSPTTALNNATISNPYTHTKTTRNYDVTITDENECEYIDGVYVIVNKLPIVKAGSLKTICEGEEIRIGGNPTGPNGALYKWSPPSSLNSFISPNPLATPKDTTIYTVIVTDSNGCEKSADVTVNVLRNPVFKFVKKPKFLCVGDTAEISVTPNLAGYSWKPESVVLNPKAAQSLVFPTLDSSVITVAGTGENGCIVELEYDLEMKALPFAKAGVDVVLCEGDSVLIGGKTNAVKVEWTPREFFLNPDSDSTIAFPVGRTKLTMKVTDEFGCKNSSSLTASAYELPHADAGEDIMNCEINTVYLGGEYTADPSHFISWTPSENLSDAHTLNPYVVNPENVTYYLKVETPEGCVNEDSITVFSDCYDKVYAPSSFTPNGDGVNDVYFISAYRITDPHLIVRDQWGHIVFESTDIAIGWNGLGITDTKEAPIGVYPFSFIYKTEQGRVLDLNGTITLVR